MEACATPQLINAVGKAVKDIGIRGVLTRATMDYSPTEGGLFSSFFESTEYAIKENIKMIKKWNNAAEGRIKAWFSFRHLFSTSDELLKEISSLAKKYGVGIHAHAAWHRPHIELVKKRTGGYDEIEHLYNLGVLGPNVLLAHVLYIDEKDIELLRRTSTNVVHCPTSNMKSAYGMTVYSKIPEMIHSGINICLGCDGTATNNSLDIISEMKLSTISHKDCRQDPTLMPAETMLVMATINGSRALLWNNEIGSIEAGKKADVIIMDMKNPKWVPCYNPISNIVYSATGDDVETVIIDGKLIMYERELLTINEAEILEKAQRIAEKIANEEGLRPQISWKVI
jgi:5-methylthioadenosine/S-adenosylhomocysteine deaminase